MNPYIRTIDEPAVYSSIDIDRSCMQREESHEVDAGLALGWELSDVDVEGTVEAEGRSQGRDDPRLWPRLV